MQDVYQYIDDHRDEYLREVQELCRRPSISAQNIGIQETAAYVKGMLEKVGATAEIVPIEGGNPVVYGEIGSGNRTLSFYNHYDVQPPEPLELWDVDPFAAEIVDGQIVARGVADNKGNIASRICAIDAYQKVRGSLPLKVKFLIEGEEEIGSPRLEKFTEEHADLIQSDGNIWESGSKDVEGRPIDLARPQGNLLRRTASQVDRAGPALVARCVGAERRLAAQLGARDAQRPGRAHSHSRLL